jgi:hypothetical protein
MRPYWKLSALSAHYLIEIPECDAPSEELTAFIGASSSLISCF